MFNDLHQRRHMAARHVLSSRSISARTAPYVAAGHIDWQGVLAESATMSGGQQYLVGIARRLWTGEAIPSPYELEGELDVVNAARVAEAVALVGEGQRDDLAAAA